MSELKPDHPEKKGADTSEFGEALGDQETRGGNLSSSAQGHSSNQNLHAGYGTASMGFHGSAAMGAAEAATVGT